MKAHIIPDKDIFFVLLVNSEINSFDYKGFNPLKYYFNEAKKVLPFFKRKGFSRGLKKKNIDHFSELPWPTNRNLKLFKDSRVGTKVMWMKLFSLLPYKVQKRYYLILKESSDYLTMTHYLFEGTAVYPYDHYLEMVRNCIPEPDIDKIYINPVFNSTLKELNKYNKLPKIPVRQQFLVLANEIINMGLFFNFKHPLGKHMQDCKKLIKKCISEDKLKKMLNGFAVKIWYNEVNCKYFNQPDTGSRKMWAKLYYSPQSDFQRSLNFCVKMFEMAYINLNCPDSLRLAMIEMYNGVYNPERAISKVDKIPPIGKYETSEEDNPILPYYIWEDYYPYIPEEDHTINNCDSVYMSWLVNEKLLERNIAFLESEKCYPSSEKSALAYLKNFIKLSDFSKLETN